LHPSRPKSIFREDNIYSWNAFDDKEKYIIDDLITDIENAGLPVIKKIQHSAINIEEKYSLCRYIAVQLLRTPRMKEHFDELHLVLSNNNLIKNLKDPEKRKKLSENMSEEHQKLIKELAENPEEKVKEMNKKFILKIKNIREIWLQCSLELLEVLANHYFKFPWYILKASKERSFITSDNPVVTISSTKNKSLITKDDINFSETILPLSPKLILLIRKENNTPVDNKIYKVRIPELPSSVRELNCRTAIFSDRYIISNSKILLLRVSGMTHGDWHDVRSDKDQYEKISKGLIPVVDNLKSTNLINRVYE
jgi:hypothetical protein